MSQRLQNKDPTRQNILQKVVYTNFIVQPNYLRNLENTFLTKKEKQEFKKVFYPPQNKYFLKTYMTLGRLQKLSLLKGP